MVPSFGRETYSSCVNFSFANKANGTLPSKRCKPFGKTPADGKTIKLISTSAYLVPNPEIDEPKSRQRISALK